MTTLSPYNIKALNALKNAFKQELANFIRKDDKYIQTMMDLTLAYVDNEIGMTDEEATHELAMMLLDSLTLTAQ
jgi:hypothetical protein